MNIEQAQSWAAMEIGDSLLFDLMFEYIRNSRSDKFGYYDTEIIISNWANKDFAKGAGTLVLQEIYKSPAHKK